jgi:8-oxo-dGTP pyrophosphatase MutT (NUDIX family)
MSKWIRDREESLIKTPIMEVMKREYHSSLDQRKHSFYVLTSNPWCNIIPLTEDGRIVLVKQFRVGVESDTFEFPGGVVDPTDSTARDAAIRELLEETGYELLPNARCEALGSVYANPAILNNLHHSFIAGPVRKVRAQHLDAGEMIEILTIPISELPSYIEKGLVKHSLMLVSLLLFLMKSASGAQTLTSELQAFVKTHPTT